MFGAGGGTSSYREVEDTDVIILWGSNARDTHPIFFHHVLKAVNRGAKLFVVDPRRTSSARWADRWCGTTANCVRLTGTKPSIGRRTGSGEPSPERDRTQ